MTAPRPVTLGPFVKGLDASTDPYTVPKGAVRRISNLLYTQRGALTDCDGTAVINWFNNGVNPGDNRRFESLALFQPAAVLPYYLVLARHAAARLGPPTTLTAADNGAGLLAAGTYFYVVTALDGAGGETNAFLPAGEASATVGANHSILLTWNVVPNAWGYNIYRGTVSRGEVVLTGVGIPVMQPSPLTATVTFVDGSLITSPGGGSQPLIGINADTDFSATANVTDGTQFYVGKVCTIAGCSNPHFNGTVKVLSISGHFLTLDISLVPALAGESGSGGTITDPPTPPTSDSTTQVALYKMPSGAIPVSYTNANIVALLPTSPLLLSAPPSGGSSSGGIAPSTPSGGIAGMTSLIPQMCQFTNRIAIAIGNGFSPQLYWDSTGTTINPAPGLSITSISVDTHGVVTVTVAGTLSTTDPTAKGFLPVGSNIAIAGVTNSAYNGTSFVIISVNTGAGTFTIQNTGVIGQAASSGGSYTVATTPLVNTFIPAYPKWAATSSYALNSIIQPNAVPETYYFKATQPGVSGGTEPTWTNAAVQGQQISDGTIIWTNQGPIQNSAPAPPGAGHIIVYSGSLWAWNTAPVDTSLNLDGPTCLRMSDVNNPFSWNPINQAFIDKDDGTEGMGLAAFTISAEGIPPEGSLVSFKNYAGYQIVGVFGSSNFAIQRIRSDMGALAPRTLKFVPGFGIVRATHLGFANFDGVRDQIISEQIRPYLFATNDSEDADIVVADSAWMPVAAADLTANPPMYALAAPIDSSNGALSRLFTYDLVLKSWSVIDLPFNVGTIYQARPVTSTPITLFAGFDDGVIQRWQAGDSTWADPTAVPVAWTVTLPDVYGPSPELKMQCRRVVIRGISSGASSLTVTPIINGIADPPQVYSIPASGDFEIFAGVLEDGMRFGFILSGSGHIELDRVVLHLLPKQIGTPSVIA